MGGTMKNNIRAILIFSFLLLSGYSYAQTTVSFQDGVSPDAGYTGTQDSYGRSTSPGANYGSDNTIISDGVAQDPDNGLFGEVAGIVKWDISSIPASATVTSASITVNLTNNSSGAYNFLQQTGAWSEGSVTWSDFNFGGVILGTIPAFAFGSTTVNLNASGIALVQAWVDGSIANDGILVRHGGTNNSIQFESTESGGNSPILEVTYTGGTQTLEERVAFLEALLAGVMRNGNKIVFDGLNVQITNGLGATNGNPGNPDSDTTTEVNGLGNLIVGYDEDINPYNVDGTPLSNKSGSHNVIIGHGHNYSSFGGFVVGQDNIISDSYASVSGGNQNTASGIWSSVSGGFFNTASASRSSVSGGERNTASSPQSSVSAGLRNTASGIGSSVSGGIDNTASGPNSSVSGGDNNTASGTESTVSGGESRSVIDTHDWRAGSLFENN